MKSSVDPPANLLDWDISATGVGLLWTLGSTWVRREDLHIPAKGRALTHTNWEHISWELLQELKAHPAAVLHVGPDTISSQKYNFSLFIHPLPLLVLLFLLISYLQIHLPSPGISHLSSTRRWEGHLELPEWHLWPLSHRSQTGVTQPLPTQLLQNRDSSYCHRP